MNKTISINISGFVFNIEEQAYEKLSHYLKSIKSNFSDEDERDEIMADIEARIAELFREKIGTSKEVIVEKDVDDVIGIMGKPEDYMTEEDQGQNNSSAKDETYDDFEYFSEPERKLYRDDDNAMLGGVCAGLGHYFNMDATLVRIIFILLVILGGSGILIYLILLLVVPEAKTTAQKLQMKGKSVTLDSIKQHAREIRDEIRENVKHGHVKRKFKKTVDRGVKASGNFARAFSKIFGLALTLGGLTALIILITIFFGNSGLVPIVGSDEMESLPTLIELIYPGTFQHNLIFISLILVTLIPIVSMIITGVKLLFEICYSYKPIAIAFGVTWLVAAAVLVITGIELGMSYRSDTEISYSYGENLDSTNVLIVDVIKDDVFSEHIQYDHVWNYAELIKVEKENVHLGYPELIIREGEDSTDFKITLYKESNGLSIKDAINKAENIQYEIKLDGNQLWLSPYFTISRTDKLRGQLPTVEVLVPKGKEVRLGENIDRIMVMIERENYEYCEHYTYANTVWRHEDGEFKCREGEQILRTYDHHGH